MRIFLKVWFRLFLTSTLVLALIIYVFYSNDLRAFWLTREGVKAIQSEDFGTAFEKMNAALQTGAFGAVHHLNLGLTQELLKREEEAIKSYTYSEKHSKDSKIQFYSWFNLGRLEAQRKNFKVALENYQRALEMDPNSEPVKINIELLFQQQQQEQKKNQDSSSQNQNDQEGKDQEASKDPKGSPNEKDTPQQSKTYAAPKKQKKKFQH